MWFILLIIIYIINNIEILLYNIVKINKIINIAIILYIFNYKYYLIK